MKGPTRSPEIRRLVHEASLLGFRVEFVEFVATASFPMAIPPEGICVQAPDLKLIRVSTRNNSRSKIAAILRHELEHAKGSDHAEDVPEHGLRCGGTYRRDPAAAAP